jgi:ATP-dependent Lon protease
MPKIFKKNGTILLPLLPLRDIVVFPYMVAPLFVGRKKSVNALADAMNGDKNIFLATQKKADIDSPDKNDISMVGTIGKVLQLLRLPDGTVKALVEGVTRARIANFIENGDFFQVELEPIVETELSNVESEALCRSVIEVFEEYSKLDKKMSKDLSKTVSKISEPSKLSDTVASHFSFKIEEKQKLLETESLSERLSMLIGLITIEIEVFEMDQKIKGRIKDQMAKTQKQ